MTRSTIGVVVRHRRLLPLVALVSACAVLAGADAAGAAVVTGKAAYGARYRLPGPAWSCT